MLKIKKKNLALNEKIYDCIKLYFQCDFDYSIFLGTPSKHQKTTIQVFREKKILGYCKITNSKQLFDIFSDEKKLLDVEMDSKGKEIA